MEIEKEVKAESVALDKTALSLNVGQSADLTAMVLPENATDKSVNWSSSDASIATVDVNGKVTAVKSGVAMITATSVNNPEAKDECFVIILQPVTGISLNQSESMLNVGERLQLRAMILPSDAYNTNVNWSSTDNEIATVDASGLVVAKKTGSTTIIATAEDNPAIKAECKVTVLQPVTAISLDQTILKFTSIGEIKQLTATVLPEDANNKKVNWTSSDNSVCMVSQNGTVVSTGRGNAIVIATTEEGGFMAICNIAVTTLHKVTYLLDGQEYYSETLEYGTVIVPQEAPSKEGYTFSGWSEIPSTMPANDVTVTGTFTVNKYMVRYYDGITLLAEYAVEYGAAIPTYEYDNEELIFEGWEGEVYDTMPAHDIAYYAITTPNGIADIKIDDNAEITVYTLTGLTVYKGRMADLPRDLRGVYIIKWGDKSIKCRL